MAKPAPVQHGIVGPNESTPGDLCVFHANVPEGASVAWQIDPPEAAARFAVDTGGRVAYFASSQKGRYVIFLAASVDGKAVAYTHVLVQGKPGPDPEPDPKPDPDPDPEPEPGRRFVLVLAETGDRTAEQASLLMGLRGYVKGKHDFRFIDPDAKNAAGKTPDWLQGYIDQVKAARVDFPALVVGVFKQNSDAEVSRVFVDPLPKTAAEAIVIVKGHGG